MIVETEDYFRPCWFDISIADTNKKGGSGVNETAISSARVVFPTCLGPKTPTAENSSNNWIILDLALRVIILAIIIKYSNCKDGVVGLGKFLSIKNRIAGIIVIQKSIKKKEINCIVPFLTDRTNVELLCG
jgi:hypothetical protein